MPDFLPFLLYAVTVVDVFLSLMIILMLLLYRRHWPLFLSPVFTLNSNSIVGQMLDSSVRNVMCWPSGFPGETLSTTFLPVCNLWANNALFWLLEYAIQGFILISKDSCPLFMLHIHTDEKMLLFTRVYVKGQQKCSFLNN